MANRTRAVGVLQVLGWLAGTWLLWRVPRCRPPLVVDDQGDLALGDVSVVIPARDEEETLPRLLDSLNAQQPAASKVVVVDDHSSDATARVAVERAATVVACDPLPRGWTGKSWACWTGAKSTDGATLVFLDADTELEPGALERVVGEHRRRGGLVSVQPFHRTERLYEAFSAFFNLVSMMGVEAFTPRSDRRSSTGAFGPCLVCSRDDYLRAGGHQAVAGDVVEDVALAKRFAASGLPVTCLGGQGTISFRMYPGGPAHLVEGWTKNFAAGAGATRPATFVMVSAWLAGCITAGTALTTALLSRRRGNSTPRAAFAYLAYALQLRWMLRRVGTFGWWPAAVYPAPLAGFLALFARSLVLTGVRKEVPWKGRMVETRPQAATGRRVPGRRAARTSASGS
ncbi:MAG: glycosyltransferase [Actinobacteria bacterium]|nr:glycosyltransferase [Actinomycetota bacterium]